jgi:hypothetical protein
VTPIFVSLVMPAIGSLSALPSITDAPVIDCPVATDMSVSVLVAWLKMSLPLPTSLRMFVNVSSMFSPDWIASSSMPTLLLIEVARFPICPR